MTELCGRSDEMSGTTTPEYFQCHGINKLGETEIVRAVGTLKGQQISHIHMFTPFQPKWLLSGSVESRNIQIFFQGLHP